MTRLLHNLPSTVLEAARGLRITDYVTGVSIKWAPTAIQELVLHERHDHQRVFVGKVRRAYVSVMFDLDDSLFAVVNEQAGQRVRVGVALDTEEHTAERIWQMSSFLQQLGIAHEATEGLITFGAKRRSRSPMGVVGSQVHCFTAGGKRAGASTGYQRMRYSEAAYYKPGQIATISAAVGQVGQEIIETTIGGHAQNFAEIKRRWRDQNALNPYRQCFVPYEMQEAYRAPPESITDEEWATMQGRGFNLRSAAAHWLRVTLPKAGGDVIRARGEYPQIEEDMFELGGGRYILRTPKEAEVFDTLDVMGVRGDVWQVELHAPPEGGSRHFVIAVDTALAEGSSNSGLVAIDVATCEIVASIASDRLKYDDLARCAQALQHALHVDRRREAPTLLVEDNGIGTATCNELDMLGASYSRVHQEGDSSGSTTEECMLAAKTAIEGDVVWEAPHVLCEECDEVSKVGKQFRGKKDLLMCLGMCLRHRKMDGGHVVEETAAQKAERLDRLDFEVAVRQDRLERSRVPPWGRG